MGRGRAGAWLPSLARTSLLRLSVDSRAVVLLLGEGGTGVVPRAERRVERRVVVSEAEEEAEGGGGLEGVVLLLLAVVVSVVPAICTSACKGGEGRRERRKGSK